MRRALGTSYEVVGWSPDEPFADQVAGASVVVDVGAHLTPDMIDRAREAGVRVWQMISAGYEYLDLAAFRDSGILVANTPGPFSPPAVAEHALLLMLCIARGFHRAEAHLHRGTFHRAFGREFSGKTLGLIGLGASGAELARIARAMRMDVLAVDTRDAARAVADELGVEFLGGPDPTAVLVNIARGGVVDQQALTHALRDGTIAAPGSTSSRSSRSTPTILCCTWRTSLRPRMSPG